MSKNSDNNVLDSDETLNTEMVLVNNKPKNTIGKIVLRWTKYAWYFGIYLAQFFIALFVYNSNDDGVTLAFCEAQMVLAILGAVIVGRCMIKLIKKHSCDFSSIARIAAYPLFASVCFILLFFSTKNYSLHFFHLLKPLGSTLLSVLTVNEAIDLLSWRAPKDNTEQSVQILAAPASADSASSQA